ncbi:hypothetical protein BHM03_00001738 [Ensete ventricosum]|nr:hypothetical protein BHM03_00001738 [Ensete ventricosum]
MQLLDGSCKVLHKGLVGVGDAPCGPSDGQVSSVDCLMRAGTRTVSYATVLLKRERNFKDFPPSESSSSMDEKSLKALETMLREHDEDSVTTESSIPRLELHFVSPMTSICMSQTLVNVPSTFSKMGLVCLLMPGKRGETPLAPFVDFMPSALVDLSEAEALEKVKALERELQGLKGDLDAGTVSCEFGYKIALTHFRTKHTGLEVEEDPYATLPEDDNVLMEVEVPFDDSDPTAM